MMITPMLTGLRAIQLYLIGSQEGWHHNPGMGMLLLPGFCDTTECNLVLNRETPGLVLGQKTPILWH